MTQRPHRQAVESQLRLARSKISNAGSPPGHEFGSEPSARVALFSLPTDIVECVLALLSEADLLRATLLSKSVAIVAERCFKRLCIKRGWRAPRHPRGENATHSNFPWRKLYRSHACRACGSPGEFYARQTTLSNTFFNIVRPNLTAGVPAIGQNTRNEVLLVCRACTETEWVQKRLIAKGMSIDQIGISGRRLLSDNVIDKRFVAARRSH